MGIKTKGLFKVASKLSLSEKPPHHMGIKTSWNFSNTSLDTFSEKPPHHSGIIQR